MSKKSNMKRTQRRRQAKAYNAAKVATHREDVAKQQEEARKAYRDLQSAHRKRVFTTGAKAVIASIAIMLMFLAGLVSWSVVRTARQRRDDQVQQGTQSPSQMVTSNMVTGMTRPATQDMSRRLRFAGFAKTDGGYDGKSVFGGRVSAQGIDDLMEERQHLEDQWQEAAERRKSSDGTTPADQAKNSDKSDVVSEANKDRYRTSTEDGNLQVGTSSDDESDGTDEESSVTDEQIRKLIESSESSTSR